MVCDQLLMEDEIHNVLDYFSLLYLIVPWLLIVVESYVIHQQLEESHQGSNQRLC
jgi:hypothetical protein